MAMLGADAAVAGMRGAGAPGADRPRSADAVDVRLKHLVVLHINAVASAMRLSPRWSLGSAANASALSSASTSTSALSLTRAAYTMATQDMAKIGAREVDKSALPDAPAQPAAPGRWRLEECLRCVLRRVSGGADVGLGSRRSSLRARRGEPRARLASSRGRWCRRAG